MEGLNYHHLMYFRAIVRAGGVTAAARRLGLAPPTLSGQVRALEEALGEKLFERRGRGVVPTDVGQMVYQYAQQISDLGREMLDAVHGDSPGRSLRLTVGIADVIPKLVARRLLQSVFDLEVPVRVVCRADLPQVLLPALEARRLDLILADGPVPPQSGVHAVSHALGEYRIAWFGAPDLARRYRPRFPRSLQAAPCLLPTENTNLRRTLDSWFEALGIEPRIVAEFEDSSLMKAFGEGALGLFPAPLVLQREILRKYGVRLVGSTTQVRDRYYAWSIPRRIDHPGIAAILHAAREALEEKALPSRRRAVRARRQ